LVPIGKEKKCLKPDGLLKRKIGVPKRERRGGPTKKWNTHKMSISERKETRGKKNLQGVGKGGSDTEAWKGKLNKGQPPKEPMSIGRRTTGLLSSPGGGGVEGGNK